MTYTDKKDMAHVVMSANSLRRGNPTTLKVFLKYLLWYFEKESKK